MHRLFYLWHNHKLFLYYILTIYIPSTFLHIMIMYMYMYMYNMNQFEIHTFIQWNYMYNLVIHDLPAPLLDMFEYHADGYNDNTRHPKELKITKFQTDIVRKSLLCKEPQRASYIKDYIKDRKEPPM